MSSNGKPLLSKNVDIFKFTLFFLIVPFWLYKYKNQKIAAESVQMMDSTYKISSI